MILTRQEHKDLFWAGFVTGVIVGGAAVAFLTSGTGRRAYLQLESTADDVRRRLDRRAKPEAQPAFEQQGPIEARPSAEQDAQEPT